MSMTKRELYELKRREASAAGRKMREWQLQCPYLKRQVELEEAGQGDLDLDQDPE
ncbi:hypothetical protein QPM17_21970 [Marinobacter sp. TBZ242]|uniref:Uncharacterized protein n=1 Tax=Marinobacter azerbaijanicus TaxID=3050455 RepID=A0ABT7IJ77_9GAMM|nr:hypothetical protein [Marinobacter sp. TBZ242]MDL0433812.1 hypothetical protein [Marinobacter sp. TBZ242]